MANRAASFTEELASIVNRAVQEHDLADANSHL